MRALAHHLIFLALLAVPVAHAQIPMQSPLPKSESRATAQSIADLRDAMHSVAADLPAMLDHPPPDESGRRVEDDIADYYMGDPVSGSLSKLTGGLADSSTRVADVNQLRDSLECRFSVIRGYWVAHESRAYHHELLQRLVARLPEADQAAPRAQLRAIDARAARLRTQIEPAIRFCDTPARARSGTVPALLDTDALLADYNAMRSSVAVQLRNAGDGGPHRTEWNQRSTACPEPAVVTPGSHGIKPRLTPDVSNYYPAEAVRFDVKGKVRLVVRFDATGCVIADAILESSGSEMLDSAALRLGLDYAVTPAAVDGQPIASSAALPVVFDIREVRDRDYTPRPAQAQP